MRTNITDEQIQQLAATAKPFSLALLSWGPERHREGADAIELEHRRRMVSLRADGVILHRSFGLLLDRLADAEVVPDVAGVVGLGSSVGRDAGVAGGGGGAGGGGARGGRGWAGGSVGWGRGGGSVE